MSSQRGVEPDGAIGRSGIDSEGEAAGKELNFLDGAVGVGRRRFDLDGRGVRWEGGVGRRSDEGDGRRLIGVDHGQNGCLTDDAAERVAHGDAVDSRSSQLDGFDFQNAVGGGGQRVGAIEEPLIVQGRSSKGGDTEGRGSIPVEGKACGLFENYRGRHSFRDEFEVKADVAAAGVGLMNLDGDPVGPVAQE